MLFLKLRLMLLMLMLLLLFMLLLLLLLLLLAHDFTANDVVVAVIVAGADIPDFC